MEENSNKDREPWTEQTEQEFAELLEYERKDQKQLEDLERAHDRLASMSETVIGMVEELYDLNCSISSFDPRDCVSEPLFGDEIEEARQLLRKAWPLLHRAVDGVGEEAGRLSKSLVDTEE